VLVVAGVVAALPWLLDVYDAGVGGQPPSHDVLSKAALALVASSALVGAAWAVACRLAGRAAPGARRVSVGVLIAGACVMAVVALSAVHDPVGRVKQQYNAFVQLRAQPGGSSRFVSGGGNRYDYWRVAVDEFQSSPFRGVGAGNYDRDYFLERRTTEDVRNPHSIWLQALGELGLVGGLLVLVFVVAVLAGFARRVRAGRRDPAQTALAVAAGGTFLVWLLHTSVDWLHLIPGLTGIALCAAAVLVSPWRPGSAGGHPRRRTAITAVAGVVAVVGAIAVGRVTLADHYRHQGQDAANAGNAALAIEHARDSLSLNDQALPTYYVLAAGQARLGRYGQARAALAEATRLEPHDFVPWGLLGDLALRRGDLATARRDYGTASRLNPRDPTLRALARDPRAALSGS
jgi:hypothetical protein